LLYAYWLRPENALWMALRSEALARCALRRPSVDLGCGDGVFSFLHCGGVLDSAFDVFTCVKTSGHALTQRTDMFDHCDDTYRPAILSEPTQSFEVGVDLKPTLLFKASRLRFYDRLLQHDNNRALPVPDGQFATVYSNAAYWLENINGFLSELRRITRPDGRIILHVKLDCMRRYTLDAHRRLLGASFLNLIGRGRMDCWPSLADRSQWERRFDQAGLEICESLPVVTRTHAHLWDIGLRPIAPLLIRMANAITPRSRGAIKRDWVELFHELLSPLCDPGFDLFGGADEAPELQYVLRPRASTHTAATSN
jgi:SAM-dependent methyltransferase